MFVKLLLVVVLMAFTIMTTTSATTVNTKTLRTKPLTQTEIHSHVKQIAHVMKNKIHKHSHQQQQKKKKTGTSHKMKAHNIPHKYTMVEKGHRNHAAEKAFAAMPEHRLLQLEEDRDISEYQSARDLPPRITAMSSYGYVDVQIFNTPTCLPHTAVENYGFRTSTCQESEEEGSYDLFNGNVYRQGEVYYAYGVSTYFHDKKCTIINDTAPASVHGYIPLNRCLEAIYIDASGYTQTTYEVYNRIATLPATSTITAGLFVYTYPTETTCMKNKSAYVLDYAFASSYDMGACAMTEDGQGSFYFDCSTGEVTLSVYFGSTSCVGTASVVLSGDELVQTHCDATESAPIRFQCVGANWAGNIWGGFFN